MLNVNSYYELSLFNNPILGTVLKGLQFQALMNYQSALKIKNVEALSKQIYPYLPDGTPSDHTKYTFYHFKKDDVDYVIASYWILPGKIIESKGQQALITINDISNEDLALVRDQLSYLGLNFEIDY